MKSNLHRTITGALCALAMIIMIIDTKTMLLGAKEGLQMCIETVIPSLFPFFILSILVTDTLTFGKFRWMKPISRICAIEENAAFLLPIGLLAGYPMGAQNIAQCYRSGVLSKEDAQRMLGFCNNAGPAFIFGMTGILFDRWFIPWILWAIQILSAIITGMILPKKSSAKSKTVITPTQRITLKDALTQSIRAMSSVCGWIVLFRVLIQFLNRWFLWLLPQTLQCALIGILELSNGCFAMMNIHHEWIRFQLCAGFLSFGGICVAMQTASVTVGLGMGHYLKGKLIQTAIALSICLGICPFIYSIERKIHLICLFSGVMAGIFLIIGILFKNNSRNRGLSVV